MERYIRFPLSIVQQNPYLFNVTARITSRNMFKRIKETPEDYSIDFREYGITNPIVARGYMGLLDLGILRDPQHLRSILTCVKPDEVDHLVLPTINTSNIDINDMLTVPHSFLSSIYARYPFIDANYNYFNLVNTILRVQNTEDGLKFLDIFIKVHNNIRSIVFGRTTSAFRSEKAKADLVDSLLPDIEHQVSLLDKAYELLKLPQGDAVHLGVGSGSSLRHTLDMEVSSAYGFLENTPSCPFPYKAVRRYNNGIEEHVKLMDMRTHRQLRGSSHADSSMEATTRNGEKIYFYKIRACPFYSYAHHERRK